MLGLMGMPRRIYTYENTDWEGYNLTSTIGSYVMAAGVLLIVVAVWRGRKGRRAGNDPWLADTLEWYDLAAAAAQLRHGPVRHERAPAQRPAGGD